MVRPKIKICGITREQDAVAAVDAGADALGFVFAPASPRRVSIETARRIVRSLPPFVTTVGVFVNAGNEEIASTLSATGIHVAQMHGEETPEQLADCPVRAYKAVRVRSGFDVRELQRYPAAIFLLDTFVEGQEGGTGQAFPWEIAREAKRFGRIILAGGLTPANVGEAIRIAQPFAIDVSSGVEESPGKKDRDKLSALFEALLASVPGSLPYRNLSPALRDWRIEKDLQELADLRRLNAEQQTEIEGLLNLVHKLRNEKEQQSSRDSSARVKECEMLLEQKLREIRQLYAALEEQTKHWPTSPSSP